MKRIAVIVGAWVMLAVPLGASAQTPRPSEIPPVITSTAPFGTGKLSRLLIVAYDAALWTDAKAWSYGAPFALSLRYHMGFESADLVDRTIDEMKGQGTLTPSDEAEYRQQLAKAFPDVKDTDRITAVYVPPRTVQFYYNGTPTHTVNDATFAPRFFDIWLSEKTSEPSLRKALLSR
ncbi:MAG: chalcone isomerase family protein [Pseudomonadota bacterium]